MPRKTGYLANILAVPPLIFRFQFNPVMLSEKKSFKYEDGGEVGNWDAFPDTVKAWKDASFRSGVLKGLTSTGGLGLGLIGDVKHYGSLLTNVKPQRAAGGEPRVFALEFQLLAGNLVSGIADGSFEFEDSPVPAGPRFEEQVYERNVLEPDLAILRSFVNPGFAVTEIPDLVKGDHGPWTRPPECLFKYGDLALACVVTDLNIKLSEFGDDALPQKADVSMTLKEQSLSIETAVDTVLRVVQASKGLGRLAAEDFGAVAPIAGSILYGGSLTMGL